MEASLSSSPAQDYRADGVRHETQSSGVSWGAVIGGAFVAAALAFILLLLGTGLGLSAVSPWAYEGSSAKNIAIAGIVWMIFTHLSASAMGGYLTGRMRTKWVDLHTDEVFFRDTANGLIAWCVGVVLTAAFLTAAATSLVGGAAKAGATATAATAGAGLAAGATQSNASESSGYFVDSLFRSDRSREDDDASVREEAGRIVANGLQQGDLPAADKTYLAQVVAARTGLAQPEAEKRVADVITQTKAAEVKARQAADAARKAAAYMTLWAFIALLTGAFTASYAATIGGKHRDHV